MCHNTLAIALATLTVVSLSTQAQAAVIDDSTSASSAPASLPAQAHDSTLLHDKVSPQASSASADAASTDSVAVLESGQEKATATPTPTTAAEVPNKIAVAAEGWLQPSALVQVWAIADYSDDLSMTLRLRRAELKLKGEIIPSFVSFGVMFDPAKVREFQKLSLVVTNPSASDANAESATVTAQQPTTPISVLQDCYISFAFEWLELSVGQFKIPVSWEGYNSSAKLLFAERSAVARSFGDKRDLGIQASKKFRYLGYTLGLFNGAGLNNLDNNLAKDAALRLEVYPLEGLTIAGVIYASLWQRDEVSAKDRYEVDLRYTNNTFLVQAEFIRARNVDASAQAIDAHGFYVATAVRVADFFEPCVRIGYLDPDLNADLAPSADHSEDELWHFDAGLNWYLSEQHVKLQLNYSRLQYDDKTPNDEVILAAQVSY